MDPRRTERFAETLRLELEELINYELSDPRITNVAVTEALVSPDGKKVHVRVAAAGDAAAQKACLEAIEKAKSFIRYTLAERIEVFRFPDLRFDSDITPETRAKAQQLLRRIRKGRPRDAGAGAAS